MPSENKCEICNKLTDKKCSACHAVYYCCRDHQKAGWKTHKVACNKCYEIRENEILGRHLVASRAIKKGEIVLKEAPIVWGPSQMTQPICLGCGGALNARKYKTCSKCGWPMCSEICENSPSHIPECSYTRNRNDKIAISNFDIPHPMYTSIMPLRCYYVKQFIQEKWTKLDKLESHDGQRKRNGTYDKDKDVAALIKRFYKIPQLDEEALLRACGIINVNAHEVPLSEPSYVAIYDLISFLEHNCSANCCKSFTSNRDIIISAGRDIGKGEHLSICYTDPLWGTFSRRQHLFQTKFFWCTCPRCTDVTEFQTYFDAFKCPKSKCNGHMLPKTFLIRNEDVNDSNSKWYCSECNGDLYTHTVDTTLQKIGQQLVQMPKKSVDACKNFIRMNTFYLHANHHYIVDVKLALIQLLGQEYVNGFPVINDEDLILKINYCKQLNELTSILTPAEKRLRGIICFELHASLVELSRRNRNASQSKNETYDLLLESRNYLLESIDFLKYEPLELPEGRMCKQARVNLMDLDMGLKTICLNS